MTEPRGAQTPHPPWPTPGGVLGRGRYRLLSEVGRDERCGLRLWRGRDLVLDRDVALTLFLAAPHDPAALTLIRSAVARALRCARLQTAGAVRVLDVLELTHPLSGAGNPATLGGADNPATVGKADNLTTVGKADNPTTEGLSAAVIVAEWTPGAALVELLDSGPLPPALAARVLVPLADAVDAAHSAGLVLGCDHPDRIRVTPSRQARLAFPGPPPASGPQDDIRGLGAMLYLLLTGCWPLPQGPSGLPPAPIGQRGTPISPTTLRPEVPVELSTLALHSIADPGTGGSVHTGAAIREVLELNAATTEDDLFSPTNRGERVRPIDPRRAARGRRIKFGVAMTVLSAATLLILGYLGMQVVSVFTDTGGTPLVVAAAAPTGKAPIPPPARSAPVAIKHLAFYDPSGLGRPDHQKDLGKLLDGNPNTGWSTDSYVDQFPIYKKGLGLLLSFPAPMAAASVTVISPSPGTVLEIRTASSANPRLSDTTLIGTATLSAAGSIRIPLRAGPPTRYLLVWITHLGGEKNHYQSRINELIVQQRAT